MDVRALLTCRHPAAGLGLALAEDGTPDFDRIVAGGGKVTGALPPLGAATQLFNVDGRITVLYAAEVDRGDGSPPVFIKGADLRADGSATRGGRRDQVVAATRFLQQPPNNLSEARALCRDGLRAWPSQVSRSVDIYA
ncbi:MAG: hypothetical protein M3P93_01740 [Actinomycetota bacterium]|nr:hypothetical protein [Actinomycetota bacterium]